MTNEASEGGTGQQANWGDTVRWKTGLRRLRQEGTDRHHRRLS